jgi:hypothetical protein
MTRRKYQLLPEQEAEIMARLPEERPAAFAELGALLGFDPETIEPVPGEASQFTAEDVVSTTAETER